MHLPLYGALSPLTMPGKGPSSLLSGLVAYWKLDEASGVRVDSHGSNHLTDNNTVGQAAGKVGNAGQFVSANAEKLTVASNPDLQGSAAYTVALWCFADSYPSNPGLFSKDDANGGPDYRLDVDSGNFRWFCFPNATPIQVAAGATGTWQFIVAWRDGDANTRNIQKDNGTVQSAGAGAAQTIGDLDLTIGSLGPTRPAQFCWDGRIDEVGFWKRVLTADERAALYNGGAGITYPFN